MAKIKLRFRLNLQREFLAFFASTIVLSLATLIALPTSFLIPLEPAKPVLSQVPLLNAESWPSAVQVDKTQIDLTPSGIPFSTDIPLKQGLDIIGGTQVTLAADMAAIPESERATALASVEEVMRRRVDLYGVSEPRIRTSVWGDQYRILIELPGLSQADSALQLIGQTAQLQFRETMADDSVATRSAEQYLNSFEPTGLDGSKLKRATVQFDQSNQPVVSLEFNTEGAELFAKVTERNIGKPLAIFLDENPVMLPTVNAAIYGGNAQITGGFSLEDAKTLAAQLNAGALPVPVKIVEQKTIGPSLGQRSLELSVQAGAIGIGLVMLFMILLYGPMGIIADVGLIAYGVLTIALYKLLPVTLSLPGIAGLMLSIGMAVDSNILTFERIKEEWRAGRSWKEALRLGFGRSWDSIKSANLATLAICFILFNPLDWGFLNTSGPVRGFALTLALGIAVSAFTGVFYSRLLLQLFLSEPKKKEQP